MHTKVLLGFVHFFGEKMGGQEKEVQWGSVATGPALEPCHRTRLNAAYI